MRPDKLIVKGLKQLGLGYPQDAVGAFVLYLEELKRWSRAYSLTSLKNDRDIVVRHFIDSCLFLKVLPDGISSVADVGSGAGFPGLPLKLMRPDWEVTLIEPSQKKAAFLRNILRRLELKGVDVVVSRVEDVGGLQVDAALTRAVFPVQRFIKSASAIVRPGGLLVLGKGPKVKEELSGASFEYEVKSVKLPLEDARRYFVLIKKEDARA